MEIVLNKQVRVSLDGATLSTLQSENEQQAVARIAIEKTLGGDEQGGGDVLDTDYTDDDFEPDCAHRVVYEFFSEGEAYPDDTMDLATFYGDPETCRRTAIALFERIRAEYPLIKLTLDNAEGGSVPPIVTKKAK